MTQHKTRSFDKPGATPITLTCPHCETTVEAYFQALAQDRLNTHECNNPQTLS